jgi:Zn-dependent peptidase ImmA (M78 family)
VCGLSVGNGDKTKIVVNKNIQNPGRKLFTGAHEIGHVILHIQNNIKNSFECTTDDIFSSKKSTHRALENEANRFASALLMPSSLIKPQVKINDITWSLVFELAHMCGTSIEATARRLITLSGEYYALIIHKDKNMWTPIKSSSFPFYIESFQFNTSLNSHKDTDKLPDYLESANLDDFFYGANFNGELRFSSIYNREFDKRMTIIELSDELDEDDSDEWDEPHF